MVSGSPRSLFSLTAAYTANGKQATDAAIKKLRGHQGACLETIKEINALQFDDLGPGTCGTTMSRYVQLTEFVVGIGLSCESVIHQMECSRTIGENPQSPCRAVLLRPVYL